MLEPGATEANLRLPLKDWIRHKDVVTAPIFFNPATACYVTADVAT